MNEYDAMNVIQQTIEDYGYPDDLPADMAEASSAAMDTLSDLRQHLDALESLKEMYYG